MIMQPRSSSPAGAALLIAATILAAVVPSYFDLTTQTPVQQQAVQQTSQAVTLNEFEKIRSGLTMAQVSLLLGRSGEEVSHVETSDAPVTSLYTWHNPDASHIDVTFQDGTVVAKSQSGLH